MKLQKILDYSEALCPMDISHILERKRQLSVLIEARSCSKPILMVTDVFNATCYGFVTNEDMFADTLAEFAMQNDLTDEDIETINANSIHI